MNEYEAKQEARRQRYADRAERLRNESSAVMKRDRDEMSAIPFGQPILVGHHSEKRHRAAIARSDARMRKAINLDSKADHYETRSQSMSTAISSDDPDAIAKLETKLAGMKASQEQMKAINADYRKRGEAAFKGLPESTLQGILGNLAFAPERLKKPYPSWALSNNGANMKRVEARIAELKARDQAPEAEDIEGEGWRLFEDDNRVQFEFDAKPPADTRTLLKRHGFKWSPNRGAWVRMLNGSGKWAATCVAKQLGG